jgi:hypothetical protein
MVEEFMQNGKRGNMLPNNIFFTGVPGSRWSGIAQVIEQVDGINTSDHNPLRTYSHGKFSGHQGTYFGKEMEFEPLLDSNYLNSAWSEQGGCKIIKSHDWAYNLDEIRASFPNDWIMLVYRPDLSSIAWWFEAGGFNIKYPSYTWYKNHAKMAAEITIQNDNILKFAHRHNLSWNYFTDQWIENNFNQTLTVENTWPDILVTILK